MRTCLSNARSVGGKGWVLETVSICDRSALPAPAQIEGAAQSEAFVFAASQRRAAWDRRTQLNRKLPRLRPVSS